MTEALRPSQVNRIRCVEKLRCKSWAEAQKRSREVGHVSQVWTGFRPNSCQGSDQAEARCLYRQTACVSTDPSVDVVHAKGNTRPHTRATACARCVGTQNGRHDFQRSGQPGRRKNSIRRHKKPTTKECKRRCKRRIDRRVWNPYRRNSRSPRTTGIRAFHNSRFTAVCPAYVSIFRYTLFPHIRATRAAMLPGAICALATFTRDNCDLIVNTQGDHVARLAIGSEKK